MGWSGSINLANGQDSGRLIIRFILFKPPLSGQPPPPPPSSACSSVEEEESEIVRASVWFAAIRWGWAILLASGCCIPHGNISLRESTWRTCKHIGWPSGILLALRDSNHWRHFERADRKHREHPVCPSSSHPPMIQNGLRGLHLLDTWINTYPTCCDECRVCWDDFPPLCLEVTVT